MRIISLLLITLFCYLTANSQTLVEGGQFMDLIMPMNGSVASDASVWVMSNLGGPTTALKTMCVPIGEEI